MEVRPGFKQTEAGVIPDAWELRTMDALTSLMTNGFVGTATSAYVDSDDGVLYVQGYNVQEGGFNFHGIKRVSKAFHARNQKSCLRPGDLLTIQTGDIGVTTVVPPALAGANCHALVISRLNSRVSEPHFYCQYFNSERGRAQLKEIETGSTMKHLNVGDMKLLLLPSPPVEEQRAIATALCDTDALLAGLDRLIAKKRDLKQAAMQQLLTGQARLPGFRGGWERKRLGDMLTICHGRNQHDVEDSSGIYPILATGGQIGAANRALYDKPSVLIGRKGTINQPRYMDTPFWTVDTLFYSAMKGDHNAKFLYYCFCLIDWMQYNEASGVPSLNARTIENVEVLAPVPAEQFAIAAVLTDMDTELTALEARRDKTRALKQGMMQELLTGRTRLV